MFESVAPWKCLLYWIHWLPPRVYLSNVSLWLSRQYETAYRRWFTGLPTGHGGFSVCLRIWKDWNIHQRSADSARCSIRMQTRDGNVKRWAIYCKEEGEQKTWGLRCCFKFCNCVCSRMADGGIDLTTWKINVVFGNACNSAALVGDDKFSTFWSNDMGRKIYLIAPTTYTYNVGTVTEMPNHQVHFSNSWSFSSSY